MNNSGRTKNVATERENTIPINRDIEASSNDNSNLKIQILKVLKHQNSKWIIFLISFNSIVVYYLWKWSISSDSLALKAYVNTVVFNICALAVCLISIWVEQNTLRQCQRFRNLNEPEHLHIEQLRIPHSKFPFDFNGCKSKVKPQLQCYNKFPRLPCNAVSNVDSKVSRKNDISVLGPEKYEVLALLVSSCFSLIVGLFVTIDAVARIREQPVLHEGRLVLGAILGLIAHLVTIRMYPDAGLDHVVCRALPCPTLKNVNPILGGNLIGFVILCAVHTTVHFWELYTVDTAAAFAVIGLIVASMLPLAFYTTSIILKKLSHHMNEQLDKCLREALIIDGVLEFRNERFWTKSFGKLAGSLDVRIRKNADEHYVLRNVVKILSQVVSTLSVQEFHEPSSSLRNLNLQLPLEYYVNELLHCKTISESSAGIEKKMENLGEIEKNVNIEEILKCNQTFKSKTEQSRRILQNGYATLLCNNEDCEFVDKKSYVFRDVPVRNALIMGSRRDLDDLQCNARLCSQNSC